MRILDSAQTLRVIELLTGAAREMATFGDEISHGDVRYNCKEALAMLDKAKQEPVVPAFVPTPLSDD